MSSSLLIPLAILVVVLVALVVLDRLELLSVLPRRRGRARRPDRDDPRAR